MESSYYFLFVLALILIFTKIFGIASSKVHLPQVVGALLAGIILGPSGFGILQSSDFLEKTAEIGVIMLMFTAGIDTDMEELKKTGLQACVIAVAGVFVPLLMCGALYFFFFQGVWTTMNVLKSAFVGCVFAATSVSITVETLNEMGKLKTRVGTTLLSAALIDDIIGIVVLSVLSGFAGNGGNVLLVVGKIGLFFVFALVCGFVFHKVFVAISKDHWQSRRVAIWALAFCFIMAYCAEEFFGVADITGAFFAGLILCNISKSRQYVAKKVTVSSYMIFAPVFFAGVGMKTDLGTMNSSILVFALILTLFGIISKVAGCGLGARLSGLTNHQSLVVGIGMVARSEVALMVAQKGIDAGMIDPAILPAIVLAVVVSGLITPILLKVSISKGPALV
ncbi:MAG: cation:proton antiporter [Lachnospiraceae bacterium]|nr:cation:proton antiporter [Lachnospiraceae bacterium]